MRTYAGRGVVSKRMGYAGFLPWKGENDGNIEGVETGITAVCNR